MSRWQRWLGSILVIAGFLVPVLPGLHTVRAQDAIHVQSDTVEVDYPFSIQFSLSVTSNSGDIASIRLFWQAGPEASFTAQPLSFLSSRTVTVDSTLNTQFLRLPPFSQIAYRWQIRDINGNELTTPNRTFEYEDTHHDWQQLENEHIRLLWYGLDEGFATKLFAVADAAYQRLALDFGVELRRRPVVLIYPDQESFTEFQAFMNNVEYVIGRYFPGHNITANLVTSDMSAEVYEATIAHELSHLYSDNFYVGFSRIPLWLEEGLATYNEGTDGQVELSAVQQAAAHDELVPFIYLEEAIRDNNIHVTNLAYAEGATVFQFITATWGQNILAAFLDAFRRTTSVGDVTDALFGLNLQKFEMAWRQWLGYPVDSVPQLPPTPTLLPIYFPTPTYVAPGG